MVLPIKSIIKKDNLPFVTGIVCTDSKHSVSFYPKFLQEICIYNAVAYVKKYADTFNICNSKTLKLIVAPRQYIRNCNVPSLDKFDLYYYSYVVYNTGKIIKSKRFYIPKFD